MGAAAWRPGDPSVSLFVLQSSDSQFPARKAEQREPRPTPPPEPPPRPPPPRPGPSALAPEPPPPPARGQAPQLGSPEPPPPPYEPGAAQWVELVGVLPPHLLLPQQKVVLEPLPGLAARASPDQRVRIQRVPQVLVFSTAATALKVGGGRRGGGRRAGGGGIRRPRPVQALGCPPGPAGPVDPTPATPVWGPASDPSKLGSRPQAPPPIDWDWGWGGELRPRP